MSIQLEHICVVCMPPYVAEKDEENNFHCVTGPALSFQDKENYSQYYIHGRGIPKEVFDVALNGELTRDVFMGETNEEYRAAWYEIMGPEAMLEILGADEISRGTFTHFGGVEEEVILYKTKETFPSLENQPLAWVKFICPSTGTNYLIDVEPHHTDAKEAAISTSPFYGQEIKTVADYSFFSRN